MSRYRVIVTDDRHGSYLEENEVLKEIGVEVEVHNLHDESDAEEVLAGADALLLNLFPMTSEIIAKLHRCRIISRYGTGYDNVDVPAATRAGIWVARVPDYAAEDASDHAIALLMACIRQIPAKDRAVRDGGWNVRLPQRVSRISGKVMGIAGYGHVGRAIHRKLSGFPFSRIMIYDPHKNPAMIRERGAFPATLDQLFSECDYISLHVPLTEDTQRMVGRRELGMMKEGAILVNTARGAVLDEEALAEALVDGKLDAAGLDVFEQEPLPASSRLRTLANVVLSDHTAYYSVESIVELKTKAARNVLRVLRGEPPVSPVNLIRAGGTSPARAGSRSTTFGKMSIPSGR